MSTVTKVSFASSPLLASKTPLWRSRLLVVLMGLAFMGLGARAAWVQVIHQDFYQKQGEVRFARTLETPAQRGRLLDRHGVVLAANVPAVSIWAIPEDVKTATMDHPEKLVELARALGMPLVELQKKLAQEDRNFVWLRRQMDGSVRASIEALGILGVYTRAESRRQYPEGEAATQLTGSLNADGKGIEGLEMVFNQNLSGIGGSRRVLKDRMGRVIEDVGDQVVAINGRDISLTIDNKIQIIAHQKLKEAVLEHHAKSGSAVVLDAQTGEVLALVNTEGVGGSGKAAASIPRNRALVDSFEPGSVMKPLTIGLALERGLVTPRSTFQTAPGSIMVGSAKITDSHAHGVLTVDQIIQKSSNVGTVKIALQMPAVAMWDFYSQLGFGQKPALPFPGIVSGRLRGPKNWQRVEQATMSYGYGLSVSLFQLAQAYSMVANDGVLVAPTLMRTDRKDSTEAAPASQRLMSAANAQAVRHMLNLAAGSEGTAPLAQVEGYTVGGKTGTAHKSEGKKGYAAKRYRSTFVGMAPIDHPRIVVAVSIDEPSNGKYFGGEIAAPIFSKTVGATLRLLGVQPDRAVKPQIAVQTTQEST
jgi:cell division protein FtsI (penicillin-binding protein 3)